ncbi:MAG: protein kinase domain-containing protein [Myxococcota bacterium]
MGSFDCPHCGAALELEVVAGTRRHTCGECHAQVWVSASISASAPAELREQKTVITRQNAVHRPPPTVAMTEPELTPVVTSPGQVELSVDEPTRSTPDGSAVHLAPGTMLGGFSLTARVGSGGMGTVWLARQLSLDRNVAVKVLRPHLGEDPAFVIQFTREALAAAQLSHHHIVQIFDIGFDRGVHFFSMEYVEGESLAAVRRREGRLEPAVAAGYVLQAARGLAFAHGRGLVHRDIKPDNLLLNRDGLVKVADLGLVKQLGGQVKKSGASTVAISFDDAELIGTPSYMAPEQVLDPSAVDARADLYALGCTFYEMLTGRPPFVGESMQQILAGHMNDAPVPPSARNARVPAVLSELVMRMLAKPRSGRPRDMSEVVGVLERFLGVEASTFSPREEHATLLENAVSAFNDASWARRRRLARVVFLGLTVATLTGAVALGFAQFAAWTALFLATSSFTAFVINAALVRAPLLLKARHLLLGASVRSWAVGFAVLGAGVGVLAWRGLLVGVLQNLGLAMVAGLASFLLLDRRVAKERRPFVEDVEQMLKAMRLRGLEEEKLRHFVCRYSGARWEEFYEALFGYEAKLEARARWGRDERGLPRKQFAAWRDPLVRFIERRLALRKERQARAQLARAEQAAAA